MNSDKIGEAILEGSAEFVQMLARKLWDYQTADEQQAELTVHKNDVGYNSADAPFVGRALETLEFGNTRSVYESDEKIIIQLRLRLFKYRAQLSDIIDEDEVEAELAVLKEIAESTCN